MTGQPFWTSLDDDRILDRGLQYGDGLFETLSLIEGRVERLSWHLRRLEKSCQHLGILYPKLEIISLLDAMCSAATGRPRVVGKLVLTRAGDRRGYKPQWNVAPRLYASAYAMDSGKDEGAPARVRLCKMRLAQQPVLAGLKHLNRLEQVLARAEWQDPAIFEGLMQDTQGNIVEGTFSNLFIVSEGQFKTPILDQCGVAGVVRAYLMDTLLQGQVQEVRMTLSDLLHADEAFICNSLIGIRPIGTLITDSETVNFPSNSRTLSLQKAFMELKD